MALSYHRPCTLPHWALVKEDLILADWLCTEELHAEHLMVLMYLMMHLCSR